MMHFEVMICKVKKKTWVESKKILSGPVMTVWGVIWRAISP